jgi:hypothetical protein
MIKFKSDDFIKALLEIYPNADPNPPQYIGTIHIRDRKGRTSVMEMWQGDAIDCSGSDTITFYPDPDYFNDTTPQTFPHARYISFVDRLDNLSFMDKLRLKTL